MVYGARELRAALGNIEAHPSVVIWASESSRDVLFAVRALDALEAIGARVTVSMKFDSFQVRLSPARFARMMRVASVLSPSSRATVAGYWRRFAAPDPGELEALRRNGCRAFPPFMAAARDYARLLPRVDRADRTVLRPSALDQLLLDALSTDEWRSLVDALQTPHRQALIDAMGAFGDFAVKVRLLVWSRRTPAVELRVGPGKFGPTSRFRLTPAGLRLRENGLRTMSDAPPITVGGYDSSRSRRAWACATDGASWRFVPLAPTPPRSPAPSPAAARATPGS